jgi:ribosomal protein S18 acetylase RimI-like enzyme
VKGVFSLANRESKYQVRNFKDGDEIEIVQLFDKTYATYGGFTLRTPDYWRWCCLKRPDVEREGLFVVVDQENEKVVGYAVAGRSGNIWELCYDSKHGGEEIASLLLSEATRYLESVGATSINLSAPKEDYVLNKVCRDFGFSVHPPIKMFLSILNFHGLISLLLNSKKEEITKEFDEVILIKLKDAPSWVEDTLSIQISRDEAQVDNKAQSPTIQVETDVITLSSLLFSVLSPFQSIIRLKLRVKPFWKTLVLLRLLSHLQVKASWFFPLSDYG